MEASHSLFCCKCCLFQRTTTRPERQSSTYAGSNQEKRESERDESSVHGDVSHVLDSVLWRQIFQYVGEDSYLGIAGTCLLFLMIYQELYDTRTTLAADLVQTVSGAEFFLRETNDESRFRIELSGFLVGRRLFSALKFIHFTAALNGRLELLQWSVDQGFPLNHPNTCAFAAYSGNLAALQWARANDCPWDSYTCSKAASNGHLTVLQWARTNGCPWDSFTCSEAAHNGHLAVLQWARSNGCPWDSWTCFEATRNGHLTVAQWARDNGCPEE